MSRKRPCAVCKHWFFPDPRVGDRQKACADKACRKEQRRRTQADWRACHPDYELGRQLDQREALDEEQRRDFAARFCAPLTRLPWDRAQDALGLQGADFIGVFGRVVLKHFQDVMRVQVPRIIGKSQGHHPAPPKDEMQSSA
jgi:hypothetical protein